MNDRSGMIRLMDAGQGYTAVTHAGIPAGTVHPIWAQGRRMWMAQGVDGRQGVFPTRRAAAAWLCGRT